MSQPIIFSLKTCFENISIDIYFKQLTSYNFFAKIILERGRNMLKKLKVSLILIVLGNVLYWILSFLSNSNNSVFSEFTSGLLLGISIGINIIGILLLIYYIVKYEQNSKK